MNNRKAETNGKQKVQLPDGFQDKLTNSELKYESGERTSYLIKEMISLYQVLKQ